MPVNGTFPVLVRVKAWLGSRLQASCPTAPVPGQLRVWLTVHVAGRKVALVTAATPVPERATGDPVTGTFAVMVAVPFTSPGVVGEKTTVIVQVAAGANVAVQVPPDWAKGAVTTTVIPVKFPVPVLLRVRVFAAVVVVSTTLPNASEVGVTLPIATVAPTYSIAPASTLRFVFLALP
jgi:hypothetical protein